MASGRQRGAGSHRVAEAAAASDRRGHRSDRRASSRASGVAAEASQQWRRSRARRWTRAWARPRRWQWWQWLNEAFQFAFSLDAQRLQLGPWAVAFLRHEQSLAEAKGEKAGGCTRRYLLVMLQARPVT